MYLQATGRGPASSACADVHSCRTLFCSHHACLLAVPSQTSSLLCLPVGGCQARPWTVFLLLSAFLLSWCYPVPWLHVLLKSSRFGASALAYLPAAHSYIQLLALLLLLLNLDPCPNPTLSLPHPELLHDSHSQLLPSENCRGPSPRPFCGCQGPLHLLVPTSSPVTLCVFVVQHMV